MFAGSNSLSTSTHGSLELGSIILLAMGITHSQGLETPHLEKLTEKALGSVDLRVTSREMKLHHPKILLTLGK
ncbi:MULTISPECIES: hypothetical protein [Metallosphaera]|uniref:hypothetical protein n=1 Tax=Metallosphaera TaxID=41980 RepID=UPI000A929A1A|nr:MULTISPECIES: hypothetical protein [Metallosphaera]MCY0861952.1 hypothetical protein [Metallosphaera prunae]WPX05749.1 hypothetical protein SOJ17_001759 [Metallosphaera sedula DSM 5348]BBL47904.1 hypothetical protein MJ1HA_2015 [Metallosphaera sedula]